MRVCYLPSDMDAPGFYRSLSPGRQLSEHGWEVFIPPYTIRTGTTQVEFKIDFDLPQMADLYVLQQRKERIWAEEGVQKLRSLGMATAMDVDDNYVNLPEYNPAFYGTHPYWSSKDKRILSRSERRKIKMPGARYQRSYQQRVMLKQPSRIPVPPNQANYLHMLSTLGQVDLVTVSTPFLADVYSAYNKNIKVIRNYVDWQIWEDVEPQYNVVRDRVRIGWLGVARYRSADLEVIRNVMPSFMKDHPDVDFVTNNGIVHEYLGIPEKQRVTVGEYDFQPIEFSHSDVTTKKTTEAQFKGELILGEMTAVCDVGLVPLADNDLNEGKSHLKGMEYNAAGIPFIASPTESYDYWMREGESGNGFLAYDADDWYSLMETLVENETLRKKSGEVGRKTARKNSIQENWREWADVYEGLIGGEYHKTARSSLSYGGVQKTSELAPFLKLVDELKPRVVVEIGTASGGTFWAIAKYAYERAHMISIDIPGGSPIDLRNGEDVYVGRDRNRIKSLIQKTQKLTLIDLSSQTQGAYVALVNTLRGMKIDLLFIDGDHRYEGVKHDYETFSPLVRDGGVVAFHDIVTHEDKRVGVSILWEELKRTHPVRYEFIGDETWGFTPWGGIGAFHA